MRVTLIFALSYVVWVLSSCSSDARSYGRFENVKSADINPQAFNAFNLWLDGQGNESLSYPDGYSEIEGTIASDGVFYVAEEDFWDHRKFTAVPTPGIAVKDKTLFYPERNGRKLILEFSPVSETPLSQPEAVEFCESMNMRMPTVREIFDFCTAGVSEANYGPDYDLQYPATGRCGEQFLWSAAVDSNYRDYAWLFYGTLGAVDSDVRFVSHAVRCVKIKNRG
jgi:hypothetical protein